MKCRCGVLLIGLASYGASTPCVGTTFQEFQLTTNAADESNILVEGDSSNRLHIVYVREGRIYYQCRHSSGPSLVPEEQVTDGDSPALALDPAGNPHVLSVSSGTVYYASRTNGAWTSATVGAADSASLAIMEDGQPYVAYSMVPSNGNGGASILLGRIETNTLVPFHTVATSYDSTYSCGGHSAGEQHDFKEPRLRCSNGVFHIVGKQVRTRASFYIPQEVFCNGVADPRMVYWRFDLTNQTSTFSDWSDHYHHLVSPSESCFDLKGSDQPQFAFEIAGTEFFCGPLNPWTQEHLFTYTTGIQAVDAAPNGVVGMLVHDFFAPPLLYLRSGGVFGAGIPVYTQAVSADLCMKYGAIATIQTKAPGSNEVYLLVNLDCDGDSLPDQEEYIAGTDPFNSNSVFQLESMATDPDTGAPILNWPGALNHLYTLYITTNWGTSWTNLGECSDQPGQGTNMTFTNLPSPPRQAWYKTGVRLAP